MPNFDINTYLANRLGSTETNTKLQQIEEASQNKIAELDAKRAAIDAQQAADKKSYEESWIGQAGLKPTGFVANRVNDVASVVSGASRLVGNTAAIPTSLASFNEMSAVNQDELDAYNRVKAGKPLTGDIAILNTPKGTDGVTPMARIDASNQARQASRDINDTFDLSKTVDQTNRRNLGKDIGRDFENNWGKVKDGYENGSVGKLAGGLAGLLSRAGTAIATNPSAVREYVLENAPQLLIGAAPGGQALMGATNIGYAVDNYQQGIENHMKANGGQLPSEEQMQKMAWQAASLALAEEAGDVVGLSAARLGGKAAEHGAGKGILKAVGEGFASEAPTEGYQTYMEGEVTGKPATAKDVWTGAVIGGASGAGLVGGIRTAQELTGSTPEKLDERKAAADKAKVVADAVESGDVSQLLDDKSKAYSPTTAIGVLQKLASNPDISEEEKQGHVAKANEIVAGLDKQRRALTGSIERTTVEGTQKQIDNAKKALLAINPDDTAKVEAKQEEIDLLTEHLDSVKTEKPKVLAAEAKSYQRQLDQIDEHLTSARTALETMSVESHKDIDVAAEVAKITGEDTGVSQTAADRIINLSMASPERLDPKVASQLANNSNLTESQRAYFRAFDDARQAEHAAKGLDGVSSDIFTGSKNYVGLTQYRSAVHGALTSGDHATADKQLKQLGDFATDHQAKADAVAEAWSMFQQDKTQPLMVVSDGNRGWTIQPGNETNEKARRAAGTVNINEKSSKLVKSIPAEAAAINTAHAELTAIAQHKAPVSPTTEGKQNGTEATQTKQAKEEGSQVPAAAGQDDPAKQSEQPTEVPVVSAAGQRESVEASGVNESTSTSEAGASGSVATSEEIVAEPEAAAPEAGTLSAVRAKSPEGTSYKLRNLIAEYFSQTANREGDATARPLVKLANFLSEGKQDLAKFLPEQDQTLTAKQQNVLQVFQNAAKHWSGRFQENLARRNQEFWYTDMMQYLIQDKDGKLDLEENVKTAMSYAAFSWIAENASKSQYNTPEEINAILDRDADSPVSRKEEDILGAVGSRQNVVLAALGQRAVQALGLKVSKDAPRDLMPKLETAMGAHIMKMMMDEGILERNGVTGADMAQLTGNSNTKENATFWFVRLAHDADGKLNKQADRVYQTSRETRNVLDKLFSVEPGLKEPSLTPVPFKQVTTKNTRQLVPSKLAKIVEHENGVANKVRQDMWQFITQVSDNIALQMAGFEEPTESTHIVNQLSMRAKNDSLVREYERFMDFVNGMEDIEAPMYFEHSVWKQQRVGIATNVINPQASKMHRFMLYRDSWTTKVDMSNTEQMNNFKLRVLEGLNVKTDKQANTKSLAAYEAKVNDPVIKNAVEVLRKSVFEGGITEAEQQVVLAGVKAGKLNFHSLDALMALAHEAQAKLEGKNEFTVQMMGEVDGVTNGPMLSHLLLGAADTVKDLFNRLNRGGFYEEGNADSQYNVWRGQPGRQDLYEVTALHMTEAIRDFLQTNPRLGNVLNTIYEFTGDLGQDTAESASARRSIIKTPLTALVFGSSTGSAVDSMADTFIESIYKKVEEAAATGDVRGVVAHINTLLNAGGERSMKNVSTEQLLKSEFTGKQIAALKKSFKDTLGKSVGEVLQSDFDTFTNRRTALNKAAQLSFNLYNSAYIGLRDAFIAELVSKGEMEVNSKGEAIHDLTPAQDAELRKRLRTMTPIMHTLMSKESNSLASGLYASKSGRKLSDRPAYAGEIKFGTGITGSKVWSSKKNAYVQASSIDTSSYETAESDPGVAMVVMSIHSTDSAISHIAADGHEVLNIHDAHGSGLKDFAQTAENLNKATWHAMLNYSPAAELTAMLSRTVTGLGQLLQQEDTPAQVKEQVIKTLKAYAEANDQDWKTVIAGILMDAKYTAHAADNLRLEALSQLQSIDQYALEGGNFKVQDADRAQAAELRAKLVEGINDKEGLALEQIAKVLGTVAKATPTTKTAEKPTVASVFGEIGTPHIKSDNTLVSFFQANPKATAKQVIDMLAIPGRLNPINRKLLQLVSRTVNPDLVVQFVTPATAESAVLATAGRPARGWFVSTANADAIYVLSPEFKSSGLTTETLLHELIHAAVSKVIDNPSAAAKELVAELDTLRIAAMEYAQAAGLNQFADALSDVQEFVAWGMSNRELQEQVLAKISVPTKTGGNKLVDGMKKFINTLTQLLWKEDEAVNNGLSVLVSNVSGLFNEASQYMEKSETGKKTVLAMSAVDQVDSYTTSDIHSALSNGAVSPQFESHLADVLTGIVQRLHGPFGAFAASMRKTEAGNPMAVWLKAMETGVAPFASQIVSSGFSASAQEDFAMQQVESTVRAALENNEATTTAVYKELITLYNEARAHLKPSDFASQADYDFVFKMESNGSMGKRSDYLSRFAALGLGNEKFNTLLKFETKTDTKDWFEGNSVADRLLHFFTKILSVFNQKLAHVYAGQAADAKLGSLVSQLVDIEARKRHDIKLRLAGNTNVVAEMGAKVDAATKAVKEKVAKLAGAKIIKESGSSLVQAGGLAVRLVAREQTDHFMDNLRKFRDKQFNEVHGLGMSIMNELKGPLQNFEALLRSTKHLENLRKGIITQHSLLALKTFANGEAMSKEQKASVSSVFLRTGMHNLLQHFTMAQLEKMLDDDNEIGKAINAFEGQLSGPMKERWIEQVNALGYYKATGRVRTPVLMFNGYSIARMMGTQFNRRVTEAQAKEAEKTLTALVSLYALRYTEQADQQAAKETVRDENNRTDGGNGVQFVLSLHKELEAESLERLFKGNPALMMHGYTPEILNPHTAIKVANAADGKDLVQQGYTQGGSVTQDATDPSQDKQHIYVLKDGGLAPYLSAAISLSSLQAKGTTQHNGYTNANTAVGLDNASTQAGITHDKLQLLTNWTNPKRDLRNDGRNQMAPVFNEQGEIVNWRYMMAESTKNELLERDNRFDQILGAHAGSIFDKQTSAEQNKQIVTAVREQYDADYHTNPDGYILVGAKSTDPVLRDTWHLLPQAMQDEIRNVWGRDGMMVRKDSVDILFGYRKFSLGEMFQKDPAARSQFEGFVLNTLEQMFRHRGYSVDEARNLVKKVGHYVTRGERMWQEVVREAKDTIVVKSGVVLLGNIWSNFSLLAAKGVPFKDMLHYHQVAIQGALAYQNDSKRLAELETLVRTGMKSDDETRREIVQLKDKIDRNPVKPLIEEGLMTSIVEDVAAQDDPFSYKTEFARKMENYTSRINPKVMDAAKFIYMGKDSWMYQNLSRVTQLSDFVARYTLYQHAINRAENPMSHKAAIQEASDAFVNYDIPMYKGLQYSDDMGITMFTKYFLRIQKVLLKTMRENPARVMTMILLNKYMSLGPIVLESSFVHHIGNNPFHLGALDYVGSLGDLATAHTALALVK